MNSIIITIIITIMGLSMLFATTVLAEMYKQDAATRVSIKRI